MIYEPPVATLNTTINQSTTEQPPSFDDSSHSTKQTDVKHSSSHQPDHLSHSKKQPSAQQPISHRPSNSGYGRMQPSVEQPSFSQEHGQPGTWQSYFCNTSNWSFSKMQLIAEQSSPHRQRQRHFSHSRQQSSPERSSSDESSHSIDSKKERYQPRSEDQYQPSSTAEQFQHASKCR